MSNSNTELEKLLVDVDDDFYWRVADILLERGSKKLFNRLRKTLRKGTEEEKLKAAAYLIALQDKKALRYYKEWIEINKKVPLMPREKSPLDNHGNVCSIGILLDLLRISYDKELVQNEFITLDRSVLGALERIAFVSDKSYIKVIKSIKKFIRNNKELVNIEYLYMFIEQIEHKRDVARSENITPEEAVSMVLKLLAKTPANQ